MAEGFRPSLYFRCRVVTAIDGWQEMESIQGRQIPPLNTKEDVKSKFELKFNTEWHLWRSGKVLKQDPGPGSEPCSTTSIFWDQHTQSHWVLGKDCNRTPDGTEEPFLYTDEWQPLQFSKFKPELPDGLRMVSHSNSDSGQLIGINHPGEHIKEILPQNFFQGKPDDGKDCKIVGPIDLVLAIVAMGVDDPELIPGYIKRSFYTARGQGHISEFLPCSVHRYGTPRQLASYPGRGLIVEVRTAWNTTSKAELEAWARGEYGPMLSSATGYDDVPCSECGSPCLQASSSVGRRPSTSAHRHSIDRQQVSAEPRGTGSAEAAFASSISSRPRQTEAQRSQSSTSAA